MEGNKESYLCCCVGCANNCYTGHDALLCIIFFHFFTLLHDACVQWRSGISSDAATATAGVADTIFSPLYGRRRWRGSSSKIRSNSPAHYSDEATGELFIRSVLYQTRNWADCMDAVRAQCVSAVICSKKTFWLPARSLPRSSLEHLAMQIFRPYVFNDGTVTKTRAPL